MGINDEIDLLLEVQEWINHDPDPETSNELLELLSNDDWPALQERFSQRLTFGTAGIRGTQGGGPNRMNRLTIRRVAGAIAEYLGHGATIVIGYDARKNSKIYAEDFATLLSRYGIYSLIFNSPVPTPIVSFAVREKSLDLGVMVTASHNPATDNGCKIFLSNGAQLCSPEDEVIDSLIQGRQLPPKEITRKKDLIRELDEKIWSEYCSSIASTVTKLSGTLTIAYTPMHGVSWPTIKRVFSLAGINNLVEVPSQIKPDPNFPTTPFPNPEEKGAMDNLFTVARECNADLAIANDPDGDRLAIGVPTIDGAWRKLTGDEIGALLCHRMVQITSGDNRKVVSTVVCSSLVEKITADAAVEHAQTLTGFKWIMPEAYRDGEKYTIFSYEEALGYSVSELVRDKDGISAALRFVEMAEDLKKKNQNILDQINDIYLKYGLHVSRSESIRITGEAARYLNDTTEKLLDRDAPEYLGGIQVLEFLDYDTVAIDQGLELPPSNMIRLMLQGGMRILIRPSGTEPVVKAYLEQVVEVLRKEDVDEERIQIHRVFDGVVEDLRGYLYSTLEI